MEVSSADLADWSDRLLSVQINDFSGMKPGPTTYNDKLTRKKEKSIFFHLLLFPEKLYTDIANETNPICVKMHIVLLELSNET